MWMMYGILLVGFGEIARLKSFGVNHCRYKHIWFYKRSQCQMPEFVEDIESSDPADDEVDDELCEEFCK